MDDLIWAPLPPRFWLRLNSGDTGTELKVRRRESQAFTPHAPPFLATVWQWLFYFINMTKHDNSYKATWPHLQLQLSEGYLLRSVRPKDSSSSLLLLAWRTFPISTRLLLIQKSSYGSPLKSVLQLPFLECHLFVAGTMIL